MARGGEICIQNLLGRSEGKRPLGNLRLRWGVILECILNKYDVRSGLNASG